MNWKFFRLCPWIDTRAKFVSGTPPGGALLDIGSSDGRTLGHMAELRPDLDFFATDLEGSPEHYPAGCRFHRGDIQSQKLPWQDAALDAITCMHLVEHLQDLRPLMSEIGRLLKPGGRVYLETPHPKSLHVKSVPGSPVALNFYDDATHIRMVTTDELAGLARAAGLEVQSAGTSRNWLLAAAHPLFALLPAGRKKFAAYTHWLGWSAYLVARKKP